MGIYLSSPDTRKHSLDGQGNGTKYGASSMQGWRLNMEDDHISEATFTPTSSLYAVFDGHGGPEVAKFCAKHFGPELKKNSKFSKETDIEGALKETFLLMDTLILTPEGQAELQTFKAADNAGDSFAGCTANVTLIHKGTIWCANAGDSRTICWSNRKLVELSYDHKPDNDIEKTRIIKAGGFITAGRVNGNLNLSRALGDMEYKKNNALLPEAQLISPMPDVMKKTLTPSDAFLVMGCDGIWEILSMEEICEVVEAELKRREKVSEVAEVILDRGLAPDTSVGIGCDNMSCIVIKLNC